MADAFVRGGSGIIQIDMGATPHVRRRNAVRCPECRSAATGTLEFLQGRALFTMGDGGAEFTGETDVWWDGQTTVYIKRRSGEFPVLLCAEGHGFTHAAVTEVG